MCSVPFFQLVIAGGTAGEDQGGGSVLQTLLNLILSEKAGVNLQKNTGSSKPMEDFIRQFTGGGGSTGNGDRAEWEIRSQTSEATSQKSSRIWRPRCRRLPSRLLVRFINIYSIELFILGTNRGEQSAGRWFAWAR
jgi:hypothetical protein